MRIIKFNESLSKQEIDDLLLDLKDAGYEMESDVFQGFIRIKGKIFETDRIQFMKDKNRRWNHYFLTKKRNLFEIRKWFSRISKPFI